MVATRRRVGRGRPAQHDHLDAERTRGGDLAIGGAAAAVLGDHDVDAMFGHQRAVIGLRERSAPGQINHMRQRQRRIDRIDAADQIMMLRRIGERRELIAAERDEHAARRLAQRTHRCRHVIDLDPAVAFDGGPGRPLQHHERHAGLPRSHERVRRDAAGIRMRRVDQHVDALARQIIRQARGAAEAAAADRNRLARGRSGPAGERQRHVELAAAGQSFRQQARFGRAAENEDAFHVAP